MSDTLLILCAFALPTAAMVLALVGNRVKQWKLMIAGGIAFTITGWAGMAFLYVNKPSDAELNMMLALGTLVIFPLMGGTIVSRAFGIRREAKQV